MYVKKFERAARLRRGLAIFIAFLVHFFLIAALVYQKSAADLPDKTEGLKNKNSDDAKIHPVP